MNTELKDLIGAKVNKIFITLDDLKFETDKGNFVYHVDGDCCSNSFFYDFYGVKNLLENGAINEIKTIQLNPTDLIVKDKYGDETKVYGYQITTEGKYGDVTSVFSFRNVSNGYYGGDINKTEDKEFPPESEIKEDVHEVK